MTKIEINLVSPNITQSISILTAALSLSSFCQHLMGLYTFFGLSHAIVYGPLMGIFV